MARQIYSGRFRAQRRRERSAGPLRQLSCYGCTLERCAWRGKGNETSCATTVQQSVQTAQRRRSSIERDLTTDGRRSRGENGRMLRTAQAVCWWCSRCAPPLSPRGSADGDRARAGAIGCGKRSMQTDARGSRREASCLSSRCTWAIDELAPVARPMQRATDTLLRPALLLVYTNIGQRIAPSREAARRACGPVRSRASPPCSFGPSLATTHASTSGSSPCTTHSYVYPARNPRDRIHGA